ncbi:hypothetical protein DYU05_01700 [Mucilaginibacter terrenus]|uniref:Uncharacterized protein n=1 Tax=Mucilaginibacter terrenus TaxID=2482727 RepID=A0A3E2NTT9_9SPHI|nr:PliI family lysozyme inhibitor of I-type lysozyme [Mucilaginibacter terrenus]RFZ84367.1 hypothetical protein DYU05_01700 [Mucilaginibacter terrenus]
MNAKYNYFIAACCTLVVACGSDEKKPTNISSVVATAKPSLMEPFRFHKAIEVAPGQTYDVVSWGRGSKSAGAYAILHSDSANIKYTTTTGDLDGNITDVYNADMDLDGNPEILIQSKGKDTVNYAKVYAFEFNNNDANKLDFPRLTSSQRKGYRGNDNFYIKEGKLIREFPIYSSNDSTATQTGAKRLLEYSLHGNDFTVKQLSKDSTSVAAPVKQEAKKTEPERKQTSAKKSSRKKSETKKRRHRRR